MIILLLLHSVNMSHKGSCHFKFHISHAFAVALLVPEDTFNLRILCNILYSASFVKLKNCSVTDVYDCISNIFRATLHIC
jgi:hypothetical protein